MVIAMRKSFQSICRILAIGVMISTASKADEMYPQSFVNVHANASSIGTYDNYGYYNNYDGIYYNYNSRSANGGGGGAALRFVIPGGLMFDASYNTDEANIGQGDMRINQEPPAWATEDSTGMRRLCSQLSSRELRPIIYVEDPARLSLTTAVELRAASCGRLPANNSSNTISVTSSSGRFLTLLRQVYVRSVLCPTSMI